MNSYTELAVLPLTEQDNFIELNTGTEQPDIPAHIIKGPDDCTVLIGSTVTLDVAYGGYPKPDVKWMRAVSTSLFFYSISFDHNQLNWLN